MNQFAKTLSHAMTPLYVEKFQLSFAPFTERYNEALYYEDETRSEILRKIAHLTDYTNLVLFIQGAEGLGKTCLLKHRLNTGKSNWRICYFNAKDYVTSEAFIEKLFSDFQLKYTADQHQAEPKSLHEQIEGLRQTGLTPVVIIDDIDELNRKLIPTLQSLITYNKDKTPIIRLVISGEDIPEYLQSILPMENGNIAIKYLPIPPMSEKETAAYIKYRLLQSGYNQVEPFNKNKLKKIYLDSKGFPKYINHLADHVMGQYAQTAGDKKNLLPISDDATKKLKIAAGVLSLIIITTLLIVLISDPDQPAEVLTEQGIKQLQIPNENSIQQTSVAASTVSSLSNSQKTNSQPTPAKASAVTKPQQVEKQIVEKEPSQQLVVNKPATPEPAPEVVKAKEKPKPAPAPKKVIKNDFWVAAQNSKYYTIQLIGSGSQIAAANFIKKHNIEKEAHYFHTTRKGKDWYSVVYKSYPNATAARSDVSKLPSSLRKIKPWIRQFQDIQKAMN